MHRISSVSRFPLAFLLTFALAAHAADMSPPLSGDPLVVARGHILAREWGPALAELQRVNARGDADWNNLMGYTLRKKTPPDLDGAAAHYKEALRIDPRHRGALEYWGELNLMRGDVAAAEGRLASLVQICGTCAEQQALKQAIERHKADKAGAK